MAHNVPCPSCGTELAVEVAVTDHRQAWEQTVERLRASAVPVADGLPNRPWIVDPLDTPEFALDKARRPRHLSDFRGGPAIHVPEAEIVLINADESPPALAPTTRRYLVEVTAEYEAGEPISSDDEFALYLWLKTNNPDGTPSGIKLVEPWIRVELDAMEPMELLRHPTRAEVYVRNTTGRPAPESVEVCGVRTLVEDFIAENWGSEEAEMVIANYRAER